MTAGLDEDLQVRDRTDADRWGGIEVRGYVHPELEILSRAKGGDGRTVTGILVPYGKAVRISDSLTEMIRKGAAAHQVRAAGRTLYSREHLKFGGQLLGKAIELRDDAAGLWGALRAVPGVAAADETLALIEAGVLDELSIGFRARQNKRHPDGTVERVKIDVVEASSVLEGAYGRDARVTGMRSAGADGDLDDGTDGAEEITEHERAAEGGDGQPAPDTMSASMLELVIARRRIVIPNGMIR